MKFRFKKGFPVLMSLLLSLFLNAQSDTSVVLTTAEYMPEYPGGFNVLLSDIASSVVYPQACLDSGIQGKVHLRFVVNIDGTISELHAVKSPHPLLSEAAIAGMREIKRFTPGMQSGQLTRVWYTFPVAFRIKQPSDSLFALDSTHANDETESVNTDTIYTFADQWPEYESGDEGLIRFLGQNIRYPIYERDNDIQGKVIVKFVIDENGYVTQAKVVQGVSPGLDAEAKRVVQLLKFFPTIHNGHPVKTYFVLPIIFRLETVPFSMGRESYTKNKTDPTSFEFYTKLSNEFESIVYKNMRYPDRAILDSIESILSVVCKLDANGKLVPFRALNDVDSIFTEEAFRLVNLLPTFDKNVHDSSSSNKLTIKIRFTLDKPNKWSKTTEVENAKRMIESGVDYFKNGDYQKALEFFNKAVSYNSLSSNAFYNIGATYLKLENKAQACDNFRRAYLLGDFSALNAFRTACP